MSKDTVIQHPHIVGHTLGIEIGPCSEKELSYSEAQLYCFMLKYNGKKGWRLPRQQEYDNRHRLSICGWFDQDHTLGSFRIHDIFYVYPIRDIDD